MMGIRSARHKGRMKIKGRPKEVAKAEIMVMKHEDRRDAERRRRMLFNFLDVVIVAAFGLALYSVYFSNYINAILFLLIGSAPLSYFIVRRILRNKHRKRR